MTDSYKHVILIRNKVQQMKNIMQVKQLTKQISPLGSSWRERLSELHKEYGNSLERTNGNIITHNDGKKKLSDLSLIYNIKALESLSPRFSNYKKDNLQLENAKKCEEENMLRGTKSCKNEKKELTKFSNKLLRPLIDVNESFIENPLVHTKAITPRGVKNEIQIRYNEKKDRLGCISAQGFRANSIKGSNLSLNKKPMINSKEQILQKCPQPNRSSSMKQRMSFRALKDKSNIASKKPPANITIPNPDDAICLNNSSVKANSIKTLKNKDNKFRAITPVTSKYTSKFLINAKSSKRVSSENTKRPRKFLNVKDRESITEYIITHIKKYNKIPPTNIGFYRIGRLLGKGAFGKVNLGMHKLTGKLVAIKSIKKARLTDNASRAKVMKEYSILKNLRHKNIIRLYESFETEKHILIVMELCSGGDILSYIKRHKKLKEETAKCIFHQLVSGLGYCHSRYTLHRDIKLENILFNHKGELKICDFGVSSTLPRGERIMEKCGTPAYIAPEILRGEGYEGFGADVWSAGVVLYTMLCGTLPFKANNMNDLQRLILRGKYTIKEDLSKKAVDLLKRILHKDPNKRLTIPEVLMHNWVKSADEKTQIFTEEEQISLDNEYWNGRNPKKTFTEHNIESVQNETIKDYLTKSIILGPFNSNATSPNINKELTVYTKESIIKMKRRLKNIDGQYEKNNNGDVDNGVYKRLLLNSNEKAIHKSNGSMNDEDISTNRRPCKVKLPLSINKPIKIDESVLLKMEMYGYPKEYVRKHLHSNELNHATTTYYLLADY